jgi:glycerophosphoryl diester phosphodiesterase
MIEIDLHRTRDGAVVVTHDADLSGLGGEGEIADATLAEVRALDAGDGERVPLLDEVLDRFGAALPFNLEIKRGSRAEYEGLEALALSAVSSRGLLERTLFSSFFDPVLARLRSLEARARIGVLVDPRWPAGWLARAQAVAAEAVNLHLRLASGNRIAQAHAEGLRVNVYTVDDEADLRRLVEAGVDGIFTNHPDRLRRILED